MVHYELLIDGVRRECDTDISVRDPATGDKVGSVTKGSAEDATEAVAAAKRTRYEWRESTPTEREAALRAVVDRLDDERDELAHLLSQETGKPIATAKGEVGETIQQFRFYAGVADTLFCSVAEPEH